MEGYKLEINNNIAKRMIAAGQDDDTIEKFIGMSQEQIDSLRTEENYNSDSESEIDEGSDANNLTGE